MKKLLWFILILALIVGGWVWWKKTPAPVARDAAEDAPIATVRTTPIETKDLALTLPVFGTIIGDVSAEHILTAPFDCSIQTVRVVSGARVAVGDVLLEISPDSDAQLQLDSSRATLDLATQALAAAQERFQLKLANSQELLAAKQAVSDAKLKVASYESRGLGGDGKILAPVAGIVSKLDSAVGGSVASGAVLASVTDEHSLVAKVSLEPEMAREIEVGQTATITGIGQTGAKAATSTIRAVGKTIDAVTGSVDAWIPIPAGATFVPGERVAVTIELKKKKGLVVPRSAVLPEGEKQVLFVIQGAKAVKREVKVLIANADAVEVSADNLQAGENVVTLGNYELTDGMAVKVENLPVESMKNPEAAR